MALTLTRGGYADTDVRFAEFFGAEHTVAGRFLFQFSHAEGGPLLAVRGRGTYVLGLRASGAGGERPALEVRIGAERLVHPLPDGRPAWHHVALVRTNGAAGPVIRLFVDGVPSGAPSGELAVPRSGLPQGTLRFGKPAGRLAGGSDLDGRGTQLYGLLGDVAVFRRALSAAEVARLAGAGQLTGTEPGLLAGYTFGEIPPGGLPLALQRLLIRTPAAMIQRIGADREGTPWAPLPTAGVVKAGAGMGKTAAALGVRPGLAWNPKGAAQR